MFSEVSFISNVYKFNKILFSKLCLIEIFTDLNVPTVLKEYNQPICTYSLFSCFETLYTLFTQPHETLSFSFIQQFKLSRLNSTFVNFLMTCCALIEVFFGVTYYLGTASGWKQGHRQDSCVLIHSTPHQCQKETASLK